MATNFNENSIVSSGGFKPSSKDTPLDIRTRVETEQDIYEIPNPYIGMIVYVKDTGKRFEILTLKEVDMGLTTKNVVDTYKQFTVDLEEYAKIEDVPTKVSELENDRGYAIEKNIDSKIETINSTINSNTNTINSKINTINSNINTINSEIDNINTDLIGVSESIEGSWISVDSKDGYLKDIEILGNTIQNQDNLADIRSVGDKLENQELYEIPVLSTNKNLFSYDFYDYSSYSQLDSSYVLKEIKLPAGIVTISNKKIKEQTSDMGTLIMQFWDNTTYSTSTRKPMINSGWRASSQNIITIEEGKKYYVAINISGNTLSKETILEKVKDMYEIQIEVGNTATPYEPYKEHKLTILSPTPLEKVGDVADRIICKDGVWGVEKNINTIVFNGSENWRKNVSSATHNRFTIDFISKGAMTDLICDQFPINGDTLTQSTVFIYNGSILIIGVSNDIVENDVNKFKAWLQTNPTTVLYQLPQPTFIPLPYDQQIKLRTFANKTNIHFGCEIEPTLKASVPKSLGATVNTHTEQIDNLSKEIDKIKKLEESTVSTVTTESNFTTVENTSNGYFEDVKIEGRTLVNLIDNSYVYNGKGLVWKGILNACKNKKVTVFVRVVNEDTTNMKVAIYRHDHVGADAGAFIQYDKSYVNKPFVVDFSTDSVTDFDCYVVYLHSHDGNSYLPMNNDNIYITVLEGDHTQNPPSFFEGLKSVGQDVDEITIVTTNAPMFFGKGGKK